MLKIASISISLSLCFRGPSSPFLQVPPVCHVSLSMFWAEKKRQMLVWLESLISAFEKRSQTYTLVFLRIVNFRNPPSITEKMFLNNLEYHTKIIKFNLPIKTQFISPHPQNVNLAPSHLTCLDSH